MKKNFFILFFLLTAASLKAQAPFIWGVTLVDCRENTSLITTKLNEFPVRMTSRLVFDYGEGVNSYTSAVNDIHKASDIMAEPVDSYDMDSYSLNSYRNRFVSYMNGIGSDVDIWEIGNEVNLDEDFIGPVEDVAAKVIAAYNEVKARNYKTALTLYYYAPGCEKKGHNMIDWSFDNLPQNVRNGLDYVFISYYYDDKCNEGYNENWNNLVIQLHNLFPNAKIGFGELGWSIDEPGPEPEEKTALMTEFYGYMGMSYYVGGYFWWNYQFDCVNPNYEYSGFIQNYMVNLVQDWLNIGYRGTSNIINPINSYLPSEYIIYQNYPNPFNPSTTISFTLPQAGFTKLTVYNSLGKEVQILVSENLKAGNYNYTFNAANFSSGVYFYKLETSGFSEVKKMLLLK